MMERMTVGARVVGVVCCPGDPATTAPPVNTITTDQMKMATHNPPQLCKTTCILREFG